MFDSLRKELGQFREEMAREWVSNDATFSCDSEVGYKAGFNALMEPTLKLVEELDKFCIDGEAAKRVMVLEVEVLRKIILGESEKARQALADFKETIKKGRMG